MKLLEIFKILALKHPVELFYVAIFALPFFVAPTNLLYGELLVYLICVPLLLVLIFITRINKIVYKFSAFLPLVTFFVVYKFGLVADDLLENEKFWATHVMAVLWLLAEPFWSDDAQFVRSLLKRISSLFCALGVAFVGYLLLLGIIYGGAYLFGFELSYNLDERLFCVCAFWLFLPCFLYLDGRFSGGEVQLVSRMIFYALSLTLCVYTVILHVYAADIALAAKLPRGMVAAIVLPYLFGGFALSMIHVLFDKFGKFYRLFGLFSLVPLALLFVGINARVSEYGLTVSRIYLICVSILAVVFCAALTA